MADIKKTVDVIFGATDSGFSTNLNKMNTSLQGVADPLANFTTDLLKTEAAIGAAGVALVGFAINEAGQFKGSINEIAALFNATAEQSDQLGTSILNFSKDSVFAIEDINAATFTAISTGTEWTEVTDLLAQSQKLAVAGSTTLSVATAALSRTMNAYGLEAGEAERVSNALFVAAQLGDTNLTALGNTFGNLAATASASNVSLEDALAAVSALTVGGIKTAESMTLLKALFRELASPSDELAAALGDVTLESNTLQEVMQVLQTATGGSQTKMDALFSSSEAVAGALILSKDSAGAFAGALDGLADKTGKVTVAYNLMAQDFEKINQRLANNFKAVLIAVGDDLLDEYGSIAGALTSIFNTIGVNLDDGALKPLADAIEDFARDLGVTLNGIALALPEALEKVDFTELLKAFEDLVGDFSSILGGIFGEELDLSQPEDLAKALQAGVNILSSFVQLTRGIIDQFQPIFDALGKAAQAASESSESAAESTGKILGVITLLGNFGTVLGGIIVAIGNSDVEFTRVVDVMVGGTKILKNGFEIAFGTIIALLAEFQAKFLETANALSLGVNDSLVDASRSARVIADNLTEGLIIDVSEFNEGMDLVTGKMSLFTKEVEKSNTEVGKAPDPQNKLTESLKNTGNQLFTSADAFDKYIAGLDKVSDQTNDTTDADGDWFEGRSALIQQQVELDEAIESAREKGLSYTVVIKDGVKTLRTWGGATDAAAESTKKAAGTLDKLSEREKVAIENTLKLELQMNQLATNERIKSMEFAAKIEIAGLEADAQKVEAIMENLSSVFDNTAAVVEQLTIGFQSSITGADRDFFKDQIDKRLKLERDTFELTKKLSDSQIAVMEAKARSLAEGSSLITIQADNLAPELQAVLKSLIDLIRIEAVNEGMEILL